MKRVEGPFNLAWILELIVASSSSSGVLGTPLLKDNCLP